MAESRTPGQTGYEAYTQSVGGVSRATGDPLPDWDRLNAIIRSAWEAAAGAIHASRAEFAMPAGYVRRPDRVLTVPEEEKDARAVQAAVQDEWDRMNPPGC